VRSGKFVLLAVAWVLSPSRIVFVQPIAIHDEERLLVGSVADREGIEDVAGRRADSRDDHIVLKLVIRWADADESTPRLGGEGIESLEDFTEFVT
jgi:hypothetical protein